MRIILSLFLWIVFCLPCLCAPRYAVKDMGAYNTGEHLALNNRGEIVGTVFSSGDKPRVAGNLPCRACLWQHGRTTIVPPASGFSATLMKAINARGQIAGTLNDTIDGATLVINNHAFLWERGRMQDLGNDAIFAVTEAEAINNQAEIVGNARGSARPVEDDDRLTQSHAFLYSHGEMTDLGLGEAHGINDRGQIVGEIPGAIYPQATLWQQGKIINLGLHGVATVINNQGQIVIGDGGRDPLYLWQDGRTRSLPILTDSAMNEADGINSRGQIVGYAMLGSVGQRAMLWQNGQVYDLNSLIPAKLGWLLASATSITDRGRIVGFGTFHGDSHAFLLTPIRAASVQRCRARLPVGSLGYSCFKATSMAQYPNKTLASEVVAHFEVPGLSFVLWQEQRIPQATTSTRLRQNVYGVNFAEYLIEVSQ